MASKNDKLTDILKELGFSNLEAQVYLAMLSIGDGTIMQIADASRVKRTSVYHVIESLKDAGLVSIQVRGFKQSYRAEHPDKLKSLVNKRRDDLVKNLPEFEAIYNLSEGESTIKYYEGIEACKHVYEEFLDELTPKDFYYIFSNQTMWHQQDPEFYDAYLVKRAKKGIKPKAIFQQTDYKDVFKKNKISYSIETKYLPKGVELTSNLVVSPKKVVIHRVTPPIIAIVIENESVVQMQKEMFEIIWSSIK